MKLELTNKEQETKQIVHVTKESGIPLIGALGWGIIDRGTNLLQVRCTSICNMNCNFCSTDAGPYSKHHKTNFLVDIDYLIEEVEKIAKFKGDGVIIFLDSVGEPMSHPNFVDLVRKLKLIKEVSEVSVITNGTFLTKEKINLLKEAGLDKINLSFHSLDSELSKKLFGMEGYNVDKVKEMISYVKEKGIELMITPVWVPNVNDKDIEDIIKFVKNIGCKIGLQKYEVYSNSRKAKGTKKQTYWKFYDQIKKWEKEYGIKLIVKAEDVKVEKRDRIPEIFQVGDRVNVEIVSRGWMPGQMIGKAEGRCVSVNNCEKDVGDGVQVEILENKNSIYLGE